MSIADPDFHRLLRFSAALSIACAVVSACAGGDDFSPRTCRADEIAPCACPGDSGAQGTQRCKADGSGFGACEGCADGGSTDARDAGCQSAADCDDGLGCNGAEQCVEGSCQAGTPACTNPEPTHCDVACVEDAGSATCHFTAKDTDGDGYLDAACSNADVPGNDCDDANSAIQPGAVEVCDGKDNDCNGLVDIDDTLTVGGTTLYPPEAALTQGDPSVAWLGAENAYGIVWTNVITGSPSEIWFSRRQQDRSLIGTSLKVSSGTTGAFNPTIAASADSFGVVWGQSVANPPPNYQVKFQTIKAGSLSAEKVVGAGWYPDITAHSTNGWVVAWNDDQSQATVKASHLDPTGATLSTKDVDFAQSNFERPKVARVGTTIGIVYVGGVSTRVVKLARLGEDVNGNISTDTVGPVDPINPTISGTAIGSNDSFFGIAWTEKTNTGTSTMYFSKYDAQGALACGPAPIVASASTDAIIMNVVPYGDGFAMLAEEPAQLLLVRVSATCEPMPNSPYTFGVTFVRSDFSDLAQGSAGWLGVWGGLSSSANYQVGIRSFGPYFCD